MELSRSQWSNDWQTILGGTIVMVVFQLAAALTLGTTELGFALVAPLVILFGPAVGLGLALGAGLVELIAGPSLFVVVRVLEVVLLAYIAHRLWLSVTPRWTRRPRAVGTVAVITAISTLVSIGGTLVLLPLIIGTGGFSVLPVLLLERLLPAIIGAPTIFFGVTLAGHDPQIEGAGSPWSAGWTLGTVAVVAVGWVGAISLFDVVRRDVAAYPHIEGLLVRPFPDPLADLVSFTVGAYGWIIYAVIGVSAMILLIGILRHWGGQPTGDVTGA